MIYSKLDLFSSQFNFNINGQQRFKGTLFGTILTLIVGICTLSYFIYVIEQYATNQIEPTFRSQSFITNSRLDLPLSTDLVGFRFEVGNGLQGNSKDKTFLVYIAYFYYSTPDVNQFIQLDVIECTNPLLQGFYCLDFSNVSNYTLALSNNDNIKSNVEIFTYGCLDVDSIKTTVPNNCANQTEIDNLINGFNSILRFKLFTSQYNTTSQQIEASYRNAFVYTVANQAILSQLKTQQQVTSVKEGPIFQRESFFSSPIQYTQQDQVQDRQYALIQTGAGAYSTAIIYLDEIVQHIQIQYPTLPQVLALVNSIFTLMMILGVLGRYFSQQSIKKDFFMLFFRNMYQNNYIKILQSCKLISQLQSPQMNNCQQIQVQENQEINEDLEEMPANPIFVPTFINKQKQSLDLEIYQYNNKDNNNNNNQNLKPVDINQKLKNLTISQEINQAKYEVESPKPLQTKIEESTPNQQIISYQSSMMVSPINSQQQKYDFTMKSVFNQELQSNFSLHTIKQPLNHHQNLANTNNSQSCLEKQNFIQTPSVLSPKYQQQIQDEQSITKNNQDSQMLADQSSQDQQIINTDQNQQFYTEGDSIIERLPNEENKEVSQKENTNKYRMQSLFRPPQYFQTSARNQTNEKKLNHEGRKAQIEQNFFRKGTSLETRFNHQNNKDQLDQNFYIQNLQNIYNQHMKNKIQDIIFRMRKSSDEFKELNQQPIRQIEDQIAEEMNIMNIIKDIIFLKKAVMMILTKDQLAALQLIGCTSAFLDLNLQKVDSSLEQLDNKSRYKGTLLGTILTIVVVVGSLMYFIYIIEQYLTNQIEPTFRSQSFITNDRIDYPLSNDLVGFRFEVGDGLQGNSKDKTFLVYIAYFYYSTPEVNQFIQLDVFECTNPNLLGFYCLDFSNVSNYTLALSNNKNIKSNIEIFTYGCLDVDSIKTTVPNNCANQTEIDNLINGFNSILRFKLFTSQYNTTSQQIESNYRSAYVYTVANQAILSQLKTQLQVTSVKQGPILQTKSMFFSPIQYTQQDQVQDRQYALFQTGAGAYSTAIIFLDEIVQQIQIQYPTLPQVLALVNSIFTLLMIFGILGRYFSQKSIKKDFFMLFFRNMYQNSYLKILQNSNIINQIEQQEQIQQQLQLNENQENIDEKAEVRNGEISIPAFEIKQKRQLDLEQSSENNNTLSSNYYQNCELKIENLTVSQEYEDNQNDTQSPINFSLQMKGKSLRQKMAQKQVQVIESSSKNEKKQQLRIQNYYENKNKHIEKFKFNSTQKLEQNLNTLSNNIDRQQITESPSLLSPIQSQQLLIKQSQSQQLTVMQNQSQLIEIEKNKGPDQLRNQKKTRENKQLFLDKFTMSSHKKNPSNFLNNQILLLKERQVDVVNYKTYLNQKFYIQNLQNINNEAKKKQIEDILFQINFFKKNEKNDWKKQHFSKIEQNIEEDMNIIKIMKDIIFLKKAIMMILTQDQLATLQLIGCSSTFLDLDVRSLNKSLEQLGKIYILLYFYSDYIQQIEKDNNLSHYESQLANLQSEKFIEENILKFLNRCSNSSNITNLDQRILFSLKKSYLN